MKQAILIISTVVLSVLNLNATTSKINFNPINTETEITENHFAKIYEWSVKTLTGKSLGISSSLEDAKEMIALFSGNEAVLKKEITSYYVLKSEATNSNNRTYYWEVVSTNGNAKELSSSERDAKEMINLVSNEEIITHKIITSEKRK
ncbi:MAG: hypothetical protein HKP48_02685 [Winogradskyella sp.]|uniref:hypothetical protein n=1 Tax=Winogradskyella sp. TaxID=1883156 RepID=UPI001797FE70|nr:hypothetical protein [Winogradskyella sp.]MBT8244940.1 hypothetical protein [Winogradskyella sp.]NNK22218.1 hypothetical protein [Winogradskyella sp.]